MLMPEQCRAARALLGWTQKELAEYSNISDLSIRNFERRQSSMKKSSQKLLRMLFENAGIIFFDQNGGGPGVRLADPVEE